MVSETDRNLRKRLMKKYDAVISATRQELYDELAKTKMKQGQDPDDFLHIMETARDRLHDMGEHISPDLFGDLILNALPSDCNFGRNTSFRDREFGVEDIKSTMRNMYAGPRSRSSSIPSIAGRGVAMPAQDGLHDVKCYICRQFGHRKEHCPKYNLKCKKTRKEECYKWCSLRNTASYSDDDCRVKGKKNPSKQQKRQGGGGAKWCSVHLNTSRADDE